MKDLRSAETKAKTEWELAQRAADLRRKAAALSALRARVWRDGAPWQDIADCPFEALAAQHGYASCVLVTDGDAVAIASVRGRFGRPVRVIQDAEMAITDHGVRWVGGQFEEIDAPDWWFRWELVDVNGDMGYAGGEPAGRDEVEFLPTKWLPPPPPGPVAVERRTN